jgi:hypothetical protein
VAETCGRGGFRNVQPFVKKLIEAVRELEFQPDLKITAMVSMEGERVPLDTPVDPRGDSNGVELWFVQVPSPARIQHSYANSHPSGHTPAGPLGGVRCSTVCIEFLC